MGESSDSFAAECFWSGVTDQDVRALDERIRAAVSEVASAGHALRYSGSLLMPTDEVVLCLFDGAEELVRLAAQRAGVPFDRIVPTTRHASDTPSGRDAQPGGG